MKTYKHILVPTDGSKLSLKAAKEAAAIAKGLKAKVTTLYVIPPWSPPMAAEGAALYHYTFNEKEYRKVTETEAGKALARAAAPLDAARVANDKLFVTNDQPWEGIVRAARSKKCDLIVMASHGRSGLAGILLGSETQKVLTHSKTPVLVCR